MKAVKKLILFSIYLIIISFVIEFYLRATGISLPAYFYDNPKLGRTLTAGREIFKVGPNKFCIDEVNKRGYTGEGYPTKKDSGTVRIALFGSSFVEGTQVFRRNRFSTFLKNDLSEKLKKNVEILNFGIGGTDFRGEYFRYIEMGKDSHADYYVFIVDSTGMCEDKKIPGPDIYVENDSLKISYAFLHKSEQKVREKFRLVRNSGLGNLFKRAYTVYYEGMLPSIILDKLYPRNRKDQSSNRSIQDRFLLINKEIIDNLGQQNRMNANKIIIVKMDDLPKFYESYFKIRDFPYIDLDAFINQNGGENKLSYWKAGDMLGHWNNLAHKLIGEFLADKIYNLINTNSFNNP